MYKTLQENVICEIEINKSRFLGFATRINNKIEADNYIAMIKKQHRKATHVCYGYILHTPAFQKSSDDGEPASTAGIPILNCLKNNDLNNTIMVVVRYFGGIKLGSNGLIRAYTSITAKTLENAKLLSVYYADHYEIQFKYNYINGIDLLLSRKKIPIIKKSFAETVIYKFYCNDNDIIKELNDTCSGDITFLAKNTEEVEEPIN